MGIGRIQGWGRSPREEVKRKTEEEEQEHEQEEEEEEEEEEHEQKEKEEHEREEEEEESEEEESCYSVGNVYVCFRMLSLFPRFRVPFISFY